MCEGGWDMCLKGCYSEKREGCVYNRSCEGE